MNSDEYDVMWVWHDTVHTGAYRLCQEQPCVALRKINPSDPHADQRKRFSDEAAWRARPKI